jgi:choline dehydrogenase-like flavoprotein
VVSTDPSELPQIDYHYLSEPSDRERMRACVRLAASLLEDKSFKELGAHRTSLGDDDLATDRSLDAWISANLATTIHMAGTCRMGPDSDPGAVTDQYCRVYGVDGLRVADTSIMPVVVRRPTNASAVMIGERASAFFD